MTDAVTQHVVPLVLGIHSECFVTVEEYGGNNLTCICV